PPTAPRPSRVGTPAPAVKLPSDPPPTSAPVRGGRPRSAATVAARSNNDRDAEAGNGGRLGPPVTLTAVPSTAGRSDRTAASTLCCSSSLNARTSTCNRAPAGTVLIVVPADAVVGVTVVP